jgi:hypothetical protein
MRFQPDDMRREARAIAASGKGAGQAWAELRQWASRHGPAAMKLAIMEYMGQYGGTPDAAFILPEVMRSASLALSPAERNELIRLAAPGQHAGAQKPGITRLAPRQSVPVAAGRPALAISFQPPQAGRQAPKIGAIEPLTPSADHAYLRDMPIVMRDRLEAARQIRPAPLGARRSGEAPGRAPNPASGSGQAASYLGAQKGEHIVRSLISSLRSHGHDSSAHPSAATEAARPASGQKPASRPSRRKSARTRRRPTKAQSRKATRRRKSRARAPAKRSRAPARAMRPAIRRRGRSMAKPRSSIRGARKKSRR